MITVYVAGLSFVPPPWIPGDGQEFEGRLRGRPDRWYRMRWHGWSVIDPSRAIIDAIEPGPRGFDVVEEMREIK